MMAHLMLSEEDQKLLIDLHTHVYLDLEYIESKCYPGHRKNSVYYRLRRLEEGEYIKHEHLPIPSIRNQVRKSGRPQNVYTLTKYGVEMVRELRGEVHWNPRWSERVATFVYHSLMLAHLECSMTLQSEKEEVLELKEWINEPRATFRYTKSSVDVIRPDGIAVIGVKDKIDANVGLFLEMERTFGTKDVLLKKIVRYNNFLQSEENIEKYDQNVGFSYPIRVWRLVFVARDAAREKELLRHLKGVESPELPVYVATFEDYIKEPFGPIYRNLENPKEKVRI